MKNELEKLTNHVRRLNSLHEELRRSTALESFCPEAFEHGACRTRIRGNPFRPEEMKFIITLGNGETITYPLLNVPLDFWQRWVPRLIEDTRGTVRAWDKYMEQTK